MENQCRIDNLRKEEKEVKNIRIWTPESDYDAEAIEVIANKIITLYGSDCSVEKSTKRAYVTAVKKQQLDKMVANYLKNDDLVIFLIDHDSLQSSSERKLQSNSLFNQITKVINSNEKAVLVEIYQELESWLLVDCLGIACYVTKNNNCREAADWKKFIRKYQKGDTSLIVEAESGGKGAKEYLEKLCDAINLKVNPTLSNKRKNLKAKRYVESQSPKVAKSILINRQTINRNLSLKTFAEYFKN